MFELIAHWNGKQQNLNKTWNGKLFDHFIFELINQGRGEIFAYTYK